MMISGRVVKVCDVETVSDKFAKKEIVVDTSSGTDRREGQDRRKTPRYKLPSD